MRNVVVVGGGMLGCQIAMQCAYKGLPVTIKDVNAEMLEKSKEKVAKLSKEYTEMLNAMKKLAGTAHPSVACGLVKSFEHLTEEDIDMLIERAEKAPDRIAYTCDMKEAVRKADIVVEAVPENVELKRTVYEEITKYISADTRVVTNSSTLVPEMFAHIFDNPENFMAMHFSNKIHINNMAEIMGDDASDDTREIVTSFAMDIGMVPVVLKKEISGCLLNSLLIPFLDNAEKLLVGGYATPEMIDLAWKKGTGARYGAFEMLDIIGLQTAMHIVGLKPDAKKEGSVENLIYKTLKEKVDAGHLGVSTGEGFYKYK